MKLLTVPTVFLALLVSTPGLSWAPPPMAPQSLRLGIRVTGGLVTQADLTELGAFGVPTSSDGSDAKAFDYPVAGPGNAMTYNPAGNGGAGSLWIGGQVVYGRIAEITIPTLVAGATSPTQLNIATRIHDMTDMFAGHITDVCNPSAGDKSTYQSGMLSYGGNFILSAYQYYDGNANAVASHFIVSSTWSSPAVIGGPYKIGTMNPGFVAGPMVPLPAAYASSLGKPYLVGQCCLSIISRSSMGPSVSTFDPADLGVTIPAPSTILLGYPQGHLNLPNATLTDYSGGMVIPVGKHSLLFFGDQGTLANYAYGTGTANPALAGQPVGDGSFYVYDPVNLSKGEHAYPYRRHVWAYDLDDLVAVKNGTKLYYNVFPYAEWNITTTLDFDSLSRVTGVAYDSTGNRLFIGMDGQDHTGFRWRPAIHVYQFQ